MSIKSIKKGAILVAKPTLSNDIFQRSVILIIESSESSVIGLIVNHISYFLVSELIAEMTNFDELIYEGGPVEPNEYFCIHRQPDIIEESHLIKNGFYWTSKMENVAKALLNGSIYSHEIKMFMGYCGWIPSQLKDEINDRFWEVLDLDFDPIEHCDAELWREIMKKLGGHNLLWLNTPEDPSMN